MRYFIHDLETDKLHVHTGGKAGWLSLDASDREAIKRNCLWSKARGCWLSRAMAGNAYLLKELLTRLGFEDRGREGERLSFAEQVEAKQEKAEARADRMEDRADAARAESGRRFEAAHTIADGIPLGQPILMGHHSERRHRKDLDRIDNNMRAECEAADNADHYRRRAEAARATAEGAQYSDPGFLARRIKEGEAEERQLLHRLAGKFYAHSTPEPISDEYRQQLTEALEQVRDKLGFYRHCLETCGRTVFTRESLKGKTQVKVRGRWEPIVRLNPTTVAVPNISFPDQEHQRKYALKYPYAEVQDAR
jgi:hypothetical protein